MSEQIACMTCGSIKKLQQNKIAELKATFTAAGRTQEETQAELSKYVRVCCMKTLLLDVNTENAWKQRQYALQTPVVASIENMNFSAGD